MMAEAGRQSADNTDLLAPQSALGLRAQPSLPYPPVQERSPPHGTGPGDITLHRPPPAHPPPVQGLGQEPEIDLHPVIEALVPSQSPYTPLPPLPLPVPTVQGLPPAAAPTATELGIRQRLPLLLKPAP